MFTIESACTTGSIWVEAGKFTDTAGNANEASNVFEWIYIPACPIAPILPTGVLAPSSGNISAKMRQAQRIKYSTAHGGMRYVSNRPTRGHPHTPYRSDILREVYYLLLLCQSTYY